MSLSKQSIKFPFCQYPSSPSEKWYHFWRKLGSGCMQIIGVGICARYLWRKSYLDNALLSEKKTDELTVLSKQSISNRNWYFKLLLANVAGFGAAIVAFNKGFVHEKFIPHAMAAFGVIAVTNMYGFMVHAYNNIRYVGQICLNKHAARINQNLRAIRNEFESAFDPKSVNFMEIQALIYGEINHAKSEWWIETYSYEKDNIYVVMNGFYRNVHFVFDMKQTAESFLLELQSNATIEMIDAMNNDPDSMRRMQKAFLRNHFYELYTYVQSLTFH